MNYWIALWTSGGTNDADCGLEAGKPMTDNLGGYTREALEHRLKTWPEYFEEVMLERKTFEIRQADRDFQVGDTLILREYYPKSCQYSGRECIRVVTYITDWEQKPGNVVMGIKPLDPRWREVEQQRDELKRHLDAIAEALGQPKGLGTCVKCGYWHGGVSSEPGHPCTHYVEALKEECGCTEPGRTTQYQPDQLAGMVRELREQKEHLDHVVSVLEAEMNPQDVQEALARDASAKESK